MIKYQPSAFSNIRIRRLWDGLVYQLDLPYQSDSGHLLRYREGGLSLLAEEIDEKQTKMNGIG